MRFLLFVSCCGMFQCAVSVGAGASERETLFFNAVIEISGKTVSGIMALNREDSSTCRMLLIAVAGPKLLDMHITGGGYRKNYCVGQLDRRAVLKFFQKDFATVAGLLRNNPGARRKPAEDGGWVEEIPLSGKDTVKYFISNDSLVTKAQYNSKRKQLFEAVYGYADSCLKSIIIRHFNFSMHITLNRFEQ